MPQRKEPKLLHSLSSMFFWTICLKRIWAAAPHPNPENVSSCSPSWSQPSFEEMLLWTTELDVGWNGFPTVHMFEQWIATPVAKVCGWHLQLPPSGGADVCLRPVSYPEVCEAMSQGWSKLPLCRWLLPAGSTASMALKQSHACHWKALLQHRLGKPPAASEHANLTESNQLQPQLWCHLARLLQHRLQLQSCTLTWFLLENSKAEPHTPKAQRQIDSTDLQQLPRQDVSAIAQHIF